MLISSGGGDRSLGWHYAVGQGRTSWADELDCEIEALTRKLEELRRTLGELRAAKHDEDHQARRLGDAMERHGGRQDEAESRLSLLDEGRRLTAQALARTEREVAGLERRLAALGNAR